MHRLPKDDEDWPTFEPIKPGFAFRKRKDLPRRNRLIMERNYRERRGIVRKGKPANPRPSEGLIFEWELFRIIRAMQQDGLITWMRKTKRRSAEDYAGIDFKLLVYCPKRGHIQIDMGVTTCLASYHDDIRRYPNSIQLYFWFGGGTDPDRVRERLMDEINKYIAKLPLPTESTTLAPPVPLPAFEFQESMLTPEVELVDAI